MKTITLLEQVNKMRLLSGLPIMESIEFNPIEEGIGGNQVIAYHGTPATFTKFSYDFVGQGNDEDGVGFYFSSSPNTAHGYSEGHGKIMKCNLRLRKTPNTKGGVNKMEIKKLMAAAPNLKDSLSDWGENPRMALEFALKTMSDAESQYDAFLNVWADFYRDSPVEFVKQLVKLGYDGVIIDKYQEHSGADYYHYVMFNPDAIEFVEYVQ